MPIKHQVSRLSLHQNAKVVAILLAVTSAVFLLPFALVVAVVGPAEPGAPPGWVFVLLPLFYLAFAYVATLLGCALYNALSRRIGGLEFETTSPGD